MKFKKILLFIFLISLAPLINHLKYGNSNSTISQAEIVQYKLREYNKQIKSKELADYIYSSIQDYKLFDDKPDIKLLLIWDIYRYGK